jgi:hypothetical protein
MMDGTHQSSHRDVRSYLDMTGLRLALDGWGGRWPAGWHKLRGATAAATVRYQAVGRCAAIEREALSKETGHGN